MQRGSEQASKPRPGQTRGKGGVLAALPPLPAGTPHLCATTPRLLPAFPRKVPLRGPGSGSSRRRQVLKGWREEGVVSPVFFCKPPNGLHFQIAKLELCPHPINLIWGKKKSQVCLTVICTTNGFGNCYNRKSSKAKGHSEFSKESRIGGGAVEQGSRERKQTPAQRGTPTKAKGVPSGAAADVTEEWGQRAWEQGGGDCFVFRDHFGLVARTSRGPLFDGWLSLISFIPLHPILCRLRAGRARRLQNGRAPYGFPQLLGPAQLRS